MSFFSFNRVTKHKKFDFIPRHYDPKKEEMDTLMGSYQDDDKASYTKERIRYGLRNKHRGDANYKKSQERSANIRLISIIFVLFLLAYLLLQSDTIGRMMETFMGQ